MFTDETRSGFNIKRQKTQALGVRRKLGSMVPLCDRTTGFRCQSRWPQARLHLLLGVQTVTRQWLGTCMVVMWMLLVSGCAAKLSAPRVGMDSLLVNLPTGFWDPSRPDFDTPRLAMRVQDALQPSFIQPETPSTALHRGDFSESGPSPQLGRSRLVDPSNDLRSDNERVDTASSAGRSRENVTPPEKSSLVSTLRFAVPSDTTWSLGFMLSHGSSSQPREVVEEQQLVDHSLDASREGHISDPDTLARHNPFRGKKLSASRLWESGQH